MEPHLENTATYNAIARLYEEKFMNLDIYNETYDRICQLLPIDSVSVLDVGCGPGNISKYLLSKRSDLSILGIDSATNMIELARKNNPNAQFKVHDTRFLNQLFGQFNAIIAGFCLPYLSPQEVAQFICQAYNKTKDEGIIYLSFVAAKKAFLEYKEGQNGHGVHFQYHEIAFITDELVIAGYSDLEVFQVLYPTKEGHDEHTIVLAKK